MDDGCVSHDFDNEEEQVDHLLHELDPGLESVFNRWTSSSRCPPLAAGPYHGNVHSKKVPVRKSPSPNGEVEFNQSPSFSEVAASETSTALPVTPSTCSEISDSDTANSKCDEIKDQVGCVSIISRRSKHGSQSPGFFAHGMQMASGTQPNQPSGARRVSWDPRITGGPGVFRKIAWGAPSSSNSPRGSSSSPRSPSQDEATVSCAQVLGCQKTPHECFDIEGGILPKVQGNWVTVRGSLVKLQGTTARWPSGYIAKLFNDVENSRIMLRFEDEKIDGSYQVCYHASLRKEDGCLVWSDGDVWVREGQSRRPEGEVCASGSRSSGESVRRNHRNSAQGLLNKAKGKRADGMVDKVSLTMLEGIWTPTRYTSCRHGPSMDITISGGTATWPSGHTGVMGVSVARGEFALRFRDISKVYSGVLRDGGTKLIWSDGDVWIRRQGIPPTDTSEDQVKVVKPVDTSDDQVTEVEVN